MSSDHEGRRHEGSPWTDGEARALVRLAELWRGVEYRARSLASARTPIQPTSTLGGPAGDYAPYADAYRRNINRAIMEVLTCSAPTPTAR